MEHILQVQIIDNDRGGHKDLIFSIVGLVDKLEFDTYHFAIEIEPYENFQDIRNALATLLTYWLTETQNAKEGLPVYLPIDFSDQYTGCLKVLKQGDKLLLNYGFSNREGYSVNPLDPGNYCNIITDFEDTVDKTIEVFKADFINSIKLQVDKLKNAS